MKKRFGKFASLFAALVLCGGALGFSAAAAEDDIVLSYSWVHEDDSTKTGSKTATNFESGWNDVMRKCNDGNIVTATLHANWSANSDGAFTDDFFNGPGFNWDAIYVNDNADLILDLNGHTINRDLRADEMNGEVIYVDDNANLTIKNGTIKGGYSNNGSGGIHINNANVTLENVTFVRCRVQNDDGLAIHMTEGTLRMNNCKFDNNELADSLYQCYGTIYVKDAKSVEMKNVTMDGDYNLDYGGVLYADNVGTLTVEDSTFQCSTVDNEGGAFWLRDIDTAVIRGCTFDTTFAGTHGGAIYAENMKDLTIENCTFSNIRADEKGGALYLNNVVKLLVKNCTFDGLKAGKGGGAIYTYADIDMEDPINRHTFLNCTFRNNTAVGSGGAFHANATDNIYEESNGTLPSTDAVFENCEFTDNTAGIWGGAIYQNPCSAVELRSSVIANNRAGTAGGGMLVGDNPRGNPQTTISGSTYILWNTGPDGRADNLYVTDPNSLVIKQILSERGTIGLRHPGGEMFFGIFHPTDATGLFNSFCSDNPEWSVLTTEPGYHPAELHLVETPIVDSPIEEPPAEEVPVEEAPAEETPAEEVPVEEEPVEEAPAEEAPVEEEPVEETPAEETPVEEAPVEEEPVEEAPAEEAPVEEAPVEEAPAEEAPVEEEPVEEESSEHTGAMVGAGTMPLVLAALCGAAAIAAYMIRSKKKSN